MCRGVAFYTQDNQKRIYYIQDPLHHKILRKKNTCIIFGYTKLQSVMSYRFLRLFQTVISYVCVCSLPVSLNWVTQWQIDLALGSFLLLEYQKFCCRVLMDFIPEWMPSYLWHFAHIFTASESLLHLHNINVVSWSTLCK